MPELVADQGVDAALEVRRGVRGPQLEGDGLHPRCTRISHGVKPAMRASGPCRVGGRGTTALAEQVVRGQVATADPRTTTTTTPKTAGRRPALGAGFRREARPWRPRVQPPGVRGGSVAARRAHRVGSGESEFISPGPVSAVIDHSSSRAHHPIRAHHRGHRARAHRPRRRAPTTSRIQRLGLGIADEDHPGRSERQPDGCGDEPRWRQR